MTEKVVIEAAVEAWNKHSERLSQAKNLQTGGGGGTSDGMEARIAKLEASAENIKESVSEMKLDIRGLRDDAKGDFRLMFGALITVAIGLAAMMAKGFGWL